MSDKVQFQMEFEVKSSTHILYNMIKTPSGLSEWFADDVNVKDDNYTFIWDGSEEVAKLLNSKKGEYVRFQWEEDVEEGNKNFFEIKIKIDELTNDKAIIITDFAEEDEIEEAKLFWQNQISELKMVIGS
ncbi:MAG TPA: SRPBCC domain-containing protein [Crocinitomix sp.]|nr:SRPBCC domain-containing protein [Crocinitomix sp.]